LRASTGCSNVAGVRTTRRLAVLVAFALATASVALARPTATADLSVKWVGIAGGVKPVAGQTFAIGASIVNAGPDAGGVRVNVRVPAGVRKVGGLFECTAEGQILHCDTFAAPVGDNGSGTVSFIADKPGSYTFDVFLDQLTATDPNVADNSDSLTVAVAAKPVTATPVSSKPPHPRAGSLFSVSMGINGAAPTAPHCTSSLGHATVRVAGSKVVCAIRTPVSCRGLVLHGKLSANAGGRTLSRPFSFRLR
jgi:hypothetical protein